MPKQTKNADMMIKITPSIGVFLLRDFFYFIMKKEGIGYNLLIE